jgi:hypothetical protein
LNYHSGLYLRKQPYYKAQAKAWQNGGQLFMSDALIERFQQLSAVLQQYRSYWQVSPFRCAQLPWADAKLQRRLDALDDQQLGDIDQSPALQQAHFSTFFPALFTLPTIDAAVREPLAPLPFWLENGIGGRKLQQINALCQQWPASPLPVLEWCAGKGHLGRILAHRFALTVTSIEWQQQLCDAGRALAQQYVLPQQFVCADVLTQSVEAVLQSQQHVIALHACGQLHINMLQQAVQAGCQQVQLVPCCYHLVSSEYYEPMSAVGAGYNLQLARDDLKLVVQGQVTAGKRIEKLRSTEILWRLAYDELRADLTGNNEYRPLASVAKHWFSADFPAFACWAAATHQLVLPAETDWAAYLRRAKRRAAMVQRIELVRHLFRRPLELWLVLDKALYLQQHGYQCSITQLCDYQITPRNLLLQATKTAP